MPTFPAWFDVDWFAQEKIKQMQILGEDVPAGETPVDQLQAAIDAYNTAHAADPGFEAVTIESNFEACNEGGYVAGVPMSAINVSPNPLFDVPTYLTSLAAKANASGYSADGYAAGEWTAETVLQHMYEDGHMSAWEHFKASGMEQMVNPSNTFNTEAYLTARAAAMGEGATVDDAIAAIKELGLNPIEDYYGFGQENGITLETVEPAIVPAMEDGGQWGGEVPPAGDDPYADIQDTQDATKGVDHLTGTDGVNTEFAANYGNIRADQTLQADDTFTGGANAYNTLQVTLGADWAGFKGVEVKDAETGATATDPNVTGVGRILLDHIATNTERTYTFNARNIDGAERIDIVNHDGGTVQLQDVAQSVQEIHLSGASDTTIAHAVTGDTGTVINYAKGAVSGSNDPMLLVLEDVGTKDSKGAVKEALVSSEGIEELTVKAADGSDNYVDLSGFSDLESLAITGGGDITVTKVAEKGITSYDASAATGIVKMYVGKIDGNTVIKGGSNADTLTLTTGNNRFAANWTGIETLAVNASCNIDMSNSDNALSQLWVNGGNATLTGVKATDFTVNQISDTANVTVNGEIENLVWSDQTTKGISGKISSDVAGNATLNVGAKQELNGAQFNLDDAKGVVTLNVAEAVANDKDSKNGEIANTKINAEAAESFTANIDGTLGDKNVFNVVGGTPNQGRSVSIIAADVAENSINTLKAKGATEVSFELTANPTVAGKSVTFNGELDNAQTVEISLANATSSAPTPTTYGFELTGALKNANEVTVTGDGNESAKIGNLGADNSNEALQLTASDLTDFTAGNMETGKGWNIDVNIDVDGNVTLGKIDAGTDEAGNGQGDVTVSVSTTSGKLNNSQDVSIFGDALTIDFSGVKDAIADSNSIILNAQSTIDYSGNGKDENVVIAEVGSGVSTIETGDGQDKVTITKLSNGSDVTVDLGQSSTAQTLIIAQQNLSATGFASVDVTLGTDNDVQDTVDITSASVGRLLINFTDFSNGTAATNDKIATFSGVTQTTDSAIAILEAFGIDADEVTLVNAGKSVIDAGILYNGNVYVADAAIVANVHTLLCFEDTTDGTWA